LPDFQPTAQKMRLVYFSHVCPMFAQRAKKSSKSLIFSITSNPACLQAKTQKDGDKPSLTRLFTIFKVP
jgi:hypothetical protein